MRKTFLFLILIIFFFSARLVLAQLQYNTYSNARFGYSITYPSNLVPKNEADNGDGQSFEAADKSAKLTVWGTNNALNKNLQQKYTEDSTEKGRAVSYKTIGDNFYVISGTQSGKIFYQKTLKTKSDSYLTFILSYAETQRSVYDPAVEEIAKSFKKLADATSSNERLEIVGAYSNVKVSKSEDPHAEGYKVELYKEGKNIFGLFFCYQGLDGDTPRGRLQDVRYDPTTGHLFFRAKLTLGQEFNQSSGPDGRPSRDLFEFDGTLKPDKIEGSLRKIDGYHTERPGETQLISLKSDPAATKSLRELVPQSLEAWMKEPIFFGPQW